MTAQTQSEAIQTATIDDIAFSFVNKEEFSKIYDDIFTYKVYSFSAATYNPVILDCGAHIGVSILFFKKLYPYAKITAFEPSPETFKLLQLNVKQNNLHDVELVNAAVCDRTDEIDFYVTKDPQSSWHWGDAAVDNGWYSPEIYNTIKVPTVKLSSYLDQCIDFLKLDIEGMEERVLREIEDKLSFVDEIRLEFHGSRTNPTNILENVIALLERNQFYYAIDQSRKIVRLDQVKRTEPYILIIYTNRRHGTLLWRSRVLPQARRCVQIPRKLHRIINDTYFFRGDPKKEF